MYHPPIERHCWASQPITAACLDYNPHLEGGGGGVVCLLMRKWTDNEGWERRSESQMDEQGLRGGRGVVGIDGE